MHACLQADEPSAGSSKIFPKRAKGKESPQKDGGEPAGASAVQPQTLQDRIAGLCKDMRKEAGEAKGLSDELMVHSIARDLCSQLADHAAFLYKAASQMQCLLSIAKPEQKDVNRLIDVIANYENRVEIARTWYEPRRTSAKGFLRPFQAKPAKRAKVADNE